MARQLDAIVPATDDIAKNFAGKSLTATVKNYPSLASGATSNRRLREKDGIFRCVYVGALSEARGISKLVEASACLGDLAGFELLFCGKYSPDTYEQEVRRLPGYDKVVHKGWIDPREVPGVLSTADVGLACLQPTENYLTALSTKLFEYMMAGVPIVASNFPLWREIIEGSQCGLCVDPRDPAGIAAAIRFLKAHPETRLAMGRNGQRAVLREFNWESQSQGLLNLYQNLLQEPPRRLAARRGELEARNREIIES